MCKSVFVHVGTCVCACVCVCVGGGVCVCVCVCVREREGDRTSPGTSARQPARVVLVQIQPVLLNSVCHFMAEKRHL